MMIVFGYICRSNRAPMVVMVTMRRILRFTLMFNMVRMGMNMLCRMTPHGGRRRSCMSMVQCSPDMLLSGKVNTVTDLLEQKQKRRKHRENYTARAPTSL